MIDREKVIKSLKDSLANLGCGYMDGVGELYAVSGEDLQNAIALLKEQEPKSGHWIDSAGADKCSVCGATYSDLYPDYQNTHYCPNCGAKMIGQAVKWNDI